MTSPSLSAPLVQHHDANRAGRDFVIGDLHGCMDALRHLLRAAAFEGARDRLFAVGDLVDRGDQCEAALGLLDRPWFYPVLGNHEEVLCAVVEGSIAREDWYDIGGEWARMLPDSALAPWAQRLRALPLVRTVGAGAARFNVLHAEFFGDDAALDAGRFDAETRERMLWGRDLALRRVPLPRRALSPTYCGHTPVHEVREAGAHVFVDTGAFMGGGKLTMVEALTPRRWSVSTTAARAAGAAAFELP